MRQWFGRRFSPGPRVWSGVSEDGRTFCASFSMGDYSVIGFGDSLQAAYLRAFYRWCRMAVGLRPW